MLLPATLFMSIYFVARLNVFPKEVRDNRNDNYKLSKRIAWESVKKVSKKVVKQVVWDLD